MSVLYVCNITLQNIALYLTGMNKLPLNEIVKELDFFLFMIRFKLYRFIKQNRRTNIDYFSNQITIFS